MMFHDRASAGRALARRLEGHRGAETLVLGIPRGGLPVASEVARHLGAELDVIVARKIGAPTNEELAIGAVAADGARHLNEDVISSLGVASRQIEEATSRKAAEARDRERRFREGRPPLRVRGRTVIVVDDGLATGATMRAAVRSLRARDPARLVVAVPVGAPETCAVLRGEVDELVCLEEPELFFAVGQFYESFPQVTDDEVVATLAAPSAA